ncbi:MAG: 50S ribosomal protein L13 [Anaerolineaceae bacterium]|nr:50S ribosomal protein L13 [Anaerolineaceae bacterium]
MKQKTFVTKPDDIEREWWVVDAKGKTLGRLATQIAVILRGKNKPTFAPNVDTGDYVVVINCDQIVTTGNKLDQKIYYRHSKYNGGLTQTPLRRQMETHPDRVIELAVKGMLPKNALGRQMLKKLKVYAGDNHPHTAQNPKPLDI